jgi:N-acyl-L-homoserine lactone synthetase
MPLSVDDVTLDDAEGDALAGTFDAPLRVRPAADPARHDVTPDGADADVLVRAFDAQFRVLPATEPALVDQALVLRHLAYCIENRFEDPALNPGGRETDAFDARSRHALLLRREDGTAVGTVRIIGPGSLAEPDLPIHGVCAEPGLRPPALPSATTAEVSRFALPKTAAGRRPTDGMLPRLGLMQAIIRLSAEAGLTHWCALMEPSLLRLFAASGIHLEPVGAIIVHHGRRQPCRTSIETLLRRLRQENPAVYAVLTDRGRLWHQLLARWGRRA